MRDRTRGVGLGAEGRLAIGAATLIVIAGVALVASFVLMARASQAAETAGRMDEPGVVTAIGGKSAAAFSGDATPTERSQSAEAHGRAGLAIGRDSGAGRANSKLHEALPEGIPTVLSGSSGRIGLDGGQFGAGQDLGNLIVEADALLAMDGFAAAVNVPRSGRSDASPNTLTTHCFEVAMTAARGSEQAEGFMQLASIAADERTMHLSGRTPV